jgi:hypothetical protein
VQNTIDVDLDTRRLAWPLSQDGLHTCKRTCTTPPDVTVQNWLSAVNLSASKALADLETSIDRVSPCLCFKHQFNTRRNHGLFVRNQATYLLEVNRLQARLVSWLAANLD